ncbi:tubulin-specific chaperone cofactor E-like protein isoform X1 [Glandiceps talaboti]
MAYWRIDLTADQANDSVIATSAVVDEIKTEVEPGAEEMEKENEENSFVRALRDKYCEASLTNLYSNSRRRRNSSAELGFLHNVVLDNCAITHAGLPTNGLETLCPNVVDLDLAKNNIKTWSEVLPIMAQLPFLKFVNLSYNKLQNHQGCLDDIEKGFVAVENFVLNGTEVSWQDVTRLAKHMPKLKELHLCTNGYKGVEHNDTKELLDTLSTVQCLRLNNNNITRWESVTKLGLLPLLKNLILSGNPLEHVEYQETINIEPKYECHGCNGDGNHGDGSQGDDEMEENVTEEVQDFLDFVVMNVVRLNSLPDEENTEAEMENSENRTSEVQNVTRLPSDANMNGGVEQGDTEDVFVSCENVNEKNGVKNENEQKVDSKNSAIGFPSLVTLCVSETHLSSWQDFAELSKFPLLTNLRIKGIKLLQELSSEERRKLFLASLPNIKMLNGSEVSNDEREKAEMHYVKYFTENESPPSRYQELVEKYGKPTTSNTVYKHRSLKKYADVTFVYRGRPLEQSSIYILQPIGKLKLYCSSLVHSTIKKVRIFHLSKNMEEDDGEPIFQELFLESLPVSRFDIMDGDEIHIEKIA